jgi:hypothetical protein
MLPRIAAFLKTCVHKFPAASSQTLGFSPKELRLLGQVRMASRKTIKPEDAKVAMEFYCSLFHPLYHEYSLDELTHYVFKYCQEWMTDDERRTTQYLAFMCMANAITNQRAKGIGRTRRRNSGMSGSRRCSMKGKEPSFIGCRIA